MSASWFDHIAWLTFGETRNVLLCHFCVEADCQRLITFSAKGDGAFVRSSFSRWKNALEHFAKHEATGTHEVVMKLSSVVRVNIGAMLDAGMKEQQLQLQCKAPLLCALPCPARASCGHEEKESNIMQLLWMWSLHGADIKGWLRESKYLSQMSR